MKSYPAPPIPESTIVALQQQVDAGATQTELIGAMREAGLSMIPSIGEAKVAVHLSEAWADCRESYDVIHQAAVTAAKELGFEEANADVREEVAR